MTVLTVVIFFTTTNAQTKLYIHPDAKNYVKNTKIMAILPLYVQVKLKPRQLRDLAPEEVTRMEENEALDIQRAMYSWFLARKKKGKLLVKVQNPKKTNVLLKKAGINIHSYNDYLPSELGKILGVETIITGTYETSKPLSNAEAIGLAFLTNAETTYSTNSATMNMDFTSTTDDELVVNYLKNVRGTLGSNAESLINTLMRKVSRRIPYTK